MGEIPTTFGVTDARRKRTRAPRLACSELLQTSTGQHRYLPHKIPTSPMTTKRSRVCRCCSSDLAAHPACPDGEANHGIDAGQFTVTSPAPDVGRDAAPRSSGE
jgi:hypothetical protein